jgi:PAS domain S-box-containing protein
MRLIDDGWENLLGLDKTQLARGRWLGKVLRSDVSMLHRLWEAALDSGGTCAAHFRIRRRDGAIRIMYAHAVPIRDEQGELTEWFGTASDVTELEEARALGEERNLRLAAAMKAASLSIVTLDLASYVLRFEGQSPFLRKDGEADGVPLHTAMGFVHADDRPVLEQGIRDLTDEAASSVHFEVRVEFADGEHWINGSALIQRETDGTPRRIIASILDISERKGLELALRDAGHRKDEFLAMLAHELRNPLAPLKTVVGLLRTHPEQISGLIEVMERQITHLARLVDDLLEVSRITQGRIALRQEPLLLGTVVYGAVEAVATLLGDQSQVLTVDLPRETAWLCGDPTRMSQIFVNILNNAIKYTPNNGRVTLRAGLDDERVFITISDTGAGISGSLLPYIFELFTQGERTLERAKGGLGIGLALVKKLVELHRGTIRIESDGPGMGTRVFLQFPRLHHDDRGSIGTQRTIPPVRRRSSRRVLIVDDNQDASDSLALVCKGEGHIVCVTYESQQALELCETFGPDVALLDIGLPDIDGYELARRFRRKGKAAPVLIAVTGYGQPEDRLIAKAAGFDHHFLKPVDINALLDTIAAVPVTSA